MKHKRTGTVAALLLAAILPSHAAFITVDDSDSNTITLTAGDFEGGFSVDGTLLTSGLFNSGSITLPDGTHTFEGSWVDQGRSGGGVHAEILFADAADVNAVTSGIQADAVSNADGSTATLKGDFGGYDGFPYFFTTNPTFPQSGGSQTTSLPFLSIEFIPEHAPDAGSSLLLMGLATTGLGFIARRARK